VLIFRTILFPLFEYVCGRGLFTADSERLVKENFGMEHLLYRGCVRGTWTKGPCTEDSARRLTEGSGNGVFL
jgi:hypothetical protein